MPTTLCSRAQASRPQTSRALPVVAACLALCIGAPVLGGTPVLSGVELHGGDRGVMLVLTADGPFDVTTAVRSSRNGPAASVATVTAKSLIYGLEVAAFDQLPRGAPVKSISVKENTRSRVVEISLKVAEGLTGSPQARQKGASTWLVLLSKTPTASFSWSAADAAIEKSAAVPESPAAPSPPTPASSKPATPVAAGAEPQAPAVPASAPSVQQPRETAPAASTVDEAAGSASAANAEAAGPAPVRLSDIRRVRRGMVEDLIFTFDGAVRWKATRQEAQILLAFENAASVLAREAFDLPQPSSFASLKLGMARRRGAPWLIATLGIPAGSDRPYSIMSSSVSSVTVSREAADSAQGVAVWSASKGLVVAHAFAGTTGQTADYGDIRTKAERDSKRPISTKETFALREAAPAPEARTAAAEIPPTASSAPAEESALPVPSTPRVKDPEPQPPPVRLVVTKDRANLRSLPSSGGESSVVAQLALGTEATQLAAKGEWREIESPQGSGWIHRSLVQKYEEVPESFWAGLKKKEAAAADAMVNALQQRAPAPADTAKPPADSTVSEPPPPVPAVPPRAGAMRALEVIEYHAFGRDPFLPLLGGDGDSTGLPTVDRMRLVGILYDDLDRVALFEDAKMPGRAYALREADEVKNGKVLQIQQNSVVFLVTEFDISRTVTVRLAKAPGQPAASQQPAERRSGRRAPDEGEPETAAGGAAPPGSKIPAWATPEAMLQQQQQGQSAAAAPPVPGLPPIEASKPPVRRRGGWAAGSGE